MKIYENINLLGGFQLYKMTKKRLIIGLIFTAIAFVVAGIVYYFSLSRNNLNSKPTTVISTSKDLQDGILFYKSRQYDKAELHLQKCLLDYPDDEIGYLAAYWTALNNYERYGIDSIESLKENLRYSMKSKFSNTRKESCIFLGEILKQIYDFDQCNSLYSDFLNNPNQVVSANDYYYILSKQVELNNNKSDWFYLSMNFVGDEYLKLNKDRINLEELDSISLYLFLSEILIYQDLYVKDSEEGFSLKNIEMEEFPNISCSNENDSIGYARICRNFGFLLRKHLDDIESKPKRDTFLNHSIALFNKSINYYLAIKKPYINIFQPAVGCAIAYKIADKIDSSNYVLSLIDTSISTLHQRANIQLYYAQNCFAEKRYNEGLNILKDAECMLTTHEPTNIYEEDDIDADKKYLYELLCDYYSVLNDVKNYNVSRENLLNAFYEIEDTKEYLNYFLTKDNIDTLRSMINRIGKDIKGLDNEKNKPNDSILSEIIAIFIILSIIIYIIYGVYLGQIAKNKFEKKFHLTNGKILNIKDIIYITKEKNKNFYTFILKNDIEKPIEYGSLAGLFDLNQPFDRDPLPTSIFLRVQNSYIINMYEVDRYIQNTDTVKMKNGDIVFMSREDKEKYLETIRECTSNSNTLSLVLREFKKDMKLDFVMLKRSFSRLVKPASKN